MSDSTTVVTHEAVAVPRFRDAYARLLDEIQKVPKGDLVTINIDIPTAVTTALGALPEIRALRSRIVAETPGFDVARFDKLESYTLAAGYAHALYLAASAPAESLDQLSAQGTALREVLLSDATALATRGFVDGQRLKELKGPVGFRNLAFDLLTLGALIRENWATIQGKTALGLDELDQAETLGDRILTAVGLREQGPAIAAEAADNRLHAFSLFVTAYDQARRAVSFLRWNEDDVDTIAPSLYANRGSSRRKAVDPGPAVPPAPVPPATPTGPAAPLPAHPPVGSAAPAAVGLPQSEPFAAR